MTTLLDFTMSPSPALLEPPLTLASPVGALYVTAVGEGPAPLRVRMETFVRHGYRAHFGAEVSSFLPSLLGASDASDTLRAVLGFRSGAEEPLFLEQYLDLPIEHALSEVVGQCIRREQIMEAGNLVTDPAIVAPAFFQGFLIWATSTSACDWLVFTGTRAVRTLLARLGAEMLEIAVARPERLREASDQWGAYYRHQPCVVAVSMGTLVPLLDPALFDPMQLRSWIDRGLELRR